MLFNVTHNVNYYYCFVILIALPFYIWTQFNSSNLILYSPNQYNFSVVVCKFTASTARSWIYYRPYDSHLLTQSHVF